ncbi:MAG: exodeoxyribonuclease III [Stellaceae bacterium]
MRIATWNVNSIKARLPLVLAWLGEARPDVVCLQEIKCLAADFPSLEIGGLGYRIEIVGQKAYNGVALLSKSPAREVITALPGDEDDHQARYVEATIDGVRIASLYLPNGNPVASDKFPYKLTWLERLRHHAAKLLKSEQPFVLAGDYNVIPEDIDVYDSAAWREDALFRPDSRAAYRRLLHLGLIDAFRALHAEPHRYSFWDYQAGRWQRDEGLRIDHLLLSPHAADRLEAADIDKGPRGKEKASDHTPAWCELRDR